jgi:1-phosphofructokinase family hexose kinase
VILTVTPNTALDRVFFLPRLRHGSRNQASQVVESMGGKGCNVSLVLRELGEATVATGLAAGDSGRRMEAMLRDGGVVPDFVWTAGETRTNTVIIETETGDHSTLCGAGLLPTSDALPGLLGWIERWAEGADCTVLAGSLPEAWSPDIYEQLVQRAAAAGKPVIVDASGPSLLAAIRPGPAAIKPNRDELESVCGACPDLPAILRGAERLRDSGAGRVLVSLGPEGAVLVSPRGAWLAQPLEVSAVNPAGAGDGMTACLALAAVRGWDEAETLRWAVAVSSAIVTTAGTGQFNREFAMRLLPDVRITPV